MLAGSPRRPQSVLLQRGGDILFSTRWWEKGQVEITGGLVLAESFHSRVLCICCSATRSCPTLETLWTGACQGPLSMGFARQEYWSGYHFLLQGIFPTQGPNLHLLHWQAVSLPLSHTGMNESQSISCSVMSDSATSWTVAHQPAIHEIFQARILEWIAIPFSRGSSPPRTGIQVSSTAGRFFIILPPGKPGVNRRSPRYMRLPG